jgi:hypothetical protein
MSDLKFAVLPFAKGSLAGCFVTLVGPRDEIAKQILVSKVCGSLTEICSEIERLKRELDVAENEARRHFEGVKSSN